MKFLRKHRILAPVILILLAVLIWCLWANTALITTAYTIASPDLPAAFGGIRIAQVSDLHNARFGKRNRKLLELLAQAQPDLILITGDLLDSRRTDPETAVAFVREALKIAPVDFVPGNHEARIPEIYEEVKAALTGLGAVILENESRILERDGQRIVLTGLTDPDFGISWQDLPAEDFQILLSHRPERFDWYAAQGADLVLTGHAHGGQVRLPWIGGLFAPHQGFFPAYTDGVHTQDNTRMVVSRGLGNSLFPLRFCNRPELIVVTLESV